MYYEAIRPIGQIVFSAWKSFGSTAIPCLMLGVARVDCYLIAYNRELTLMENRTRLICSHSVPLCLAAWGVHCWRPLGRKAR